jgi:hypothetical protein
MLTLLACGQSQNGTYVELMLQAYKLRVYAEAGVFEAEECLRASLKTLDNYQVDPDAQIVRDYATRVRANGGTVEGFESTISSIKNLNNSDLYDKASLSLFSSGVKAGKAYSILPINGNGDFDIIRSTTKTRTNGVGLIETVAANVPSLNYDTIGGSPSILIEPQRTNLAIFSQNIDNIAWTQTQSSVIVDTHISIDGNLNADTLVSTATNFSLMFQVYSLDIKTYTYSIFAKKINLDFVVLKMDSSPFGFVSAWFNISNGTIGTVGSGLVANIQSYINGYYRLSITFTMPSAGNQKISPHIALGNNSTATSINSSTIFFGAQLEEGSFATSYIPTLGSAVTRNQDVLNKTGISSLIGQTEGAIVIEILPSELGSISLNDGSNLNVVKLFLNKSTNIIELQIRAGGLVAVGLYGNSLNLTKLNKIAILYKSGNNSIWANGIKLNTFIANYVFSNLLSFLEFRSPTGGEVLFCKLNSIQLYKTALTDAECITLTS